MSKNEILQNGKYIKTVYGISKVFEWRVYHYKGRRFEVSMFSEEVNEIKKNYCDLCGRGTFKNTCCGRKLIFI